MNEGLSAGDFNPGLLIVVGCVLVGIEENDATERSSSATDEAATQTGEPGVCFRENLGTLAECK